MKEDTIILVAEDDAGNFSLLKRTIRRAGFAGTVLHFSTGRSLIDFFMSLELIGALKKKKCMVFLDYELPEMDGIEVMDYLRGDSRFCPLSIYILSAQADPDIIRRAYDGGADGFLEKPVAAEQLRVLLQCTQASTKSGQESEVNIR